VEQLAEADRRVAVEPKVLRQRDHVRQRLAEVPPQVPDAERIRPPPGQDGRARRVADRLLTVGAGEPDAAARERVEVGRARLRVAVGAEVRPQVVRGDEQHVRPRRRGGQGDDGR
jgi:hypothetical protein